MSRDREFVSAVLKNLPEPSDNVKLGWIMNPMGLQEALKKALCPPKKEDESDWDRLVSHWVRANQGRVIRPERGTCRVKVYSMTHPSESIEADAVLVSFMSDLAPHSMMYVRLDGNTAREAIFRDGKWFDIPD